MLLNQKNWIAFAGGRFVDKGLQPNLDVVAVGKLVDDMTAKHLFAEATCLRFVADKPFEAGKGIVHMVFLSHFLGDGRRGFDDVR